MIRIKIKNQRQLKENLDPNLFKNFRQVSWDLDSISKYTDETPYKKYKPSEINFNWITKTGYSDEKYDFNLNCSIVVCDLDNPTMIYNSPYGKQMMVWVQTPNDNIQELSDPSIALDYAKRFKEPSSLIVIWPPYAAHAAPDSTRKGYIIV